MEPVSLPLKQNPLLPVDLNSMSFEQQQQFIDVALTLLAKQHQPGALLNNPKATRDFLRLLLRNHLNEVFGCIFLNSQHTVIDSKHLFFGTIDSTSIYPRVVAQHCLERNAAAVIIYHNHPSGNCEPSQADQRMTRHLIEALALLDIRVLDHIVVGAAKTSSFAELGLI